MSYIASTMESSLALNNLPDRLAAALRENRRDRIAGIRMSPELSYGRHAGPAPFGARRAAVILLLFQRAGRWHLPLTQRPATLVRHAGQVSLPGGSIEPGESSSQAALRELGEELGIEDGVNLVGRLPDCYVFASDFLVTPWLAAVGVEPNWRPHGAEVQDIVELPLHRLLDERCVGQMIVERGPLRFYAPCLQVRNARVWGATGVILAELADVLRQLHESEADGLADAK